MITAAATPQETTAAPGRSLLPHHARDLRASGLSDETIMAAGIYSETRCTALAAILGWASFPNKMAPALVIPFRDAEGNNGYLRVKPDNPKRDTRGKSRKYESPKGQPNRVYFPPGVSAALEFIDAELLITEGEKKALSANQRGFRTIGLVGVYGWKAKGAAKLLPELERIPWTGRKVFIAFDSDISDKPQVLEAESQLAKHLQNRGAVVKVIRFPDGPAGDDGKPMKVGLDDFLVANELGALRQLMDKASEPGEQAAIVGKVSAKQLDPASEAEAYLQAHRTDGVYRLRFWRNAFYLWSLGRYIETEPSEVRGSLVTYLNTDYSMVTTGITANVMAQVQALSMLAGQREPACWVDSPTADWPADEILVARNGLIHLPSLIEGKPAIKPLTPRLFTLSALDYEFDAGAADPAAWLAFLDQLWSGDGQSIDALQEWFGYCLTADTSLQKILLLIGPKRSGKGTICRILAALVGQANVAGPTLSGLATNFGLWPLLNKSIAIISDARLGGRTDQQIVVERLLTISGEDSITVDRKMREPVTGKIGARLLIASNEVPRLPDSSGALAGRMILLRLTESFYGKEDSRLTTRLMGELPGILNWSIEGWRRLRDHGRFMQPVSAVDMLEDMQDLTSPVGEFVRTECDIGLEFEVSRPLLYERYKAWAESRGRKSVEDEAGFGRALRSVVAGIDTKQSRIEGSRVRFYVGVGLKSI